MPQHFLILLDISYSMSSHIQSMLNGINTFISNLKKYPDVYVTILLFCDRTKYLCDRTHILQINEFTREDIPFFGTTYLYDSVRKILEEHINEQGIDHHLYIITDGDDNGSRNTTRGQAIELCDTAVEHYGWNITHCDIDISKLAYGNVKSVVYNPDEIEQLLGNLVI